MGKVYSIAEARDHLTSLVHEVEMGDPITLTRRGKPVAVLVSEVEYARLTGGKKGFWTAMQEWRAKVNAEGGVFPTGEEFEGLRDKSPGRDFKWGD